MLPIESTAAVRQQERRHDLFVLVQRRHVEQELLGVDAFRVEQDQVDAEAIQLVARAVVEHEHRAAPWSVSSSLLSSIRSSALGGHRGLCDDEQAERGETAPSLARPAADREGSLISMVFRPDGRIISPRRIASDSDSQVSALHGARRVVQRMYCRSKVEMTSRASTLPRRPHGVRHEQDRSGNFFEDFALGQEILHATPRTVTEGDATLYLALTGSSFAVHCSATLARMAGLPRPPLDDLLTFHLVFGRTVPDVSLNAIANLGYADGRFGALLYPGDTLNASSKVIGLKESSSGNSGTV